MAPEDPPTVELPAPLLGAEGQRCSNCDAELGVDQRYCLNCGQRRSQMRLPFLELAGAGAATTPVPPVPSRPAERSALIPLGALIVLLLALGIGVLIGRGTGAEPRAAAQPSILTVATPAPTAPGTAVPTAVVSDWPAGTKGFTVALQSLPATATLDAVTQAKQQATTKGATDVGALKSDEYPSLTPGEIVIYSGTFPARPAAQAALKKLRSSFPAGKVVEVSSTATSAGAGAATTTTPKAGSSSGQSTEDYRKRSKTIPDEVQSEGTPPPTDNAAPGDGSSATEIG